MIHLLLYSFSVTLLSLIAIILFERKYGFFLDPGISERPQHYHTLPTPRAGGIGILLGMGFYLSTSLGVTLAVPLLLSFFSGILEDYHRALSPKARLLLQTIAALSAIWLTGSVVTYLGLGITMPYWLGILFSTFAIVGMMNAVNIIDGFNGLASGVILLILLSFGLTAYMNQNTDMLQLIVITIGAVLGFLALNFPTGKIFLGDGGAYLLGFIVAIIGIFLASKYESVSPWYIMALFVYPVWEVLFSIFRKLCSGLSPMEPDAYHFHMLVYRQLSHSNPKTTLYILGLILPFMTLATLYPNKSNLNMIIALGFIVTYTLLYRHLYRKDTA